MNENERQNNSADTYSVTPRAFVRRMSKEDKETRFMVNTVIQIFGMVENYAAVMNALEKQA